MLFIGRIFRGEATMSLSHTATAAGGTAPVGPNNPFPVDFVASSTSVSTNVAAAAANTSILAANVARRGGNIVNDSTSIMYVKLSTGASATSYDYFLAGSTGGVPTSLEIPRGYTGPIFAFWASAVGAARVSERT